MNQDVLLLKELSEKIQFERIPLFRETIMKIKSIQIKYDDIDFLVCLYSLSEDIACRCFILQTLILRDNGRLHDFFINAYKKEKYLDMKLTAIRGYANYVSEQKVEKIVFKFTELLIKKAEKTPYNYQEYEPLRSVFGLSYLIKKYKYQC